MRSNPLPETLVRLVEQYVDQSQQPVIYDPEAWSGKLSDVVDAEWVRDALTDSGFTAPVAGGTQSTARDDVQSYLSAELLSDDQLLRGLILVIAWGNGIKVFRGFRHTADAFRDQARLLANLHQSRDALRAMSALDLKGLETTARRWDVPGIGQSFY